MRYNLSQQPGFSLKTAFKLVDVEESGFINPYSLLKFLNSEGIIWEEQEAKFVIAEFDAKPLDEQWTKSEFADMILPFYYERSTPPVINDTDPETERKRMKAISF